MASGFVVNKIVAVKIGPGGVAMIGQFNSFIQIAQAVGKAGINTGVTRYVSQNRDNLVELTSICRASLAISFISSTIVAVTIVIFSNYLSLKIFNTQSYAYLFVMVGIFLFFFVLNNLLLSILNGIKKIKYFTLINITQSLCSLFFTSLLVYSFGLEGGLFAIATNQSVVFIIAIYFIFKHKVLSLSHFFPVSLDRKKAQMLLKYSVMALTSAIVAPFSLMLVRDLIIEIVSIDAAGYWQGIWSLSSTYLMVVTTTLNTYYLPKLSETKNPENLRHEISLGYKRVLPFVIMAAMCLFLARSTIINILFSKSFGGMEPLFKFQLLGDILKISSWLVGMVLSVRGLIKSHIISELFFSTSFVVLSHYFLKNFGLVGVTYAYCLNYFLHLLTMVLIVKKLRMI